jgi:hypothetical protein
MTDEVLTAPVVEEVQPIAEYNKTEAALGFLRQRMANVEYDVTTTKGMAVAVADRAEVRGLRTSLESKRKELKAPALDYAKRIDSEAKRITAALLELEEPIDAQIKAEQARKEAEKSERERVERERITAIHARIAEVRGFVPLARECRTSERMAGLLERMTTHWIAFNFEDDFQEFGAEAQNAFDMAKVELEKMIGNKVAEETERAKFKAEQEAAAAAIAALKAEQEAAAEKLAIAQAAFEAERAAFQAFKAAKLAEEAALADAADKLATQATEEAQQVMVIGEVEAPTLVEQSPLPAIEMAVIDSKVTITQEKKKPRDIAIVECLALNFNVHEATVLDWLESMDIPALWGQIESEFA